MTTTFSDLGLPDRILAVLSKNGIDEPFPIQAAAIPDVLGGADVAAKAPTGSGKTLAFGLPMLARVPVAGPKKPTSLILAPTRELAAQIRLALAPYGKAMNRQVFAVYGGVRYQTQVEWLNRGVDVLVATPGRLEDLIDQGAIDLGSVAIVAVDEADRMADMGFLPSVERILDQTASNRQTLLFSATLDGDVKALVRRYQRNPVRHEVGGTESIASDASHHFWQVDHKDKIAHTADTVAATGSTIVFVKTRHGTDRVAKQLGREGVDAVAIHGGLSQNQRNRALKSFADGKATVLVATDVAARGIHVDDVSTVVHFDVPHGHKDYLHRSGRTARAGAGGTVVSLFTKPERRAVVRMQKNLDMHEPITPPRPEALGALAGTTAKVSAPRKHHTADERPQKMEAEHRPSNPVAPKRKKQHKQVANTRPTGPSSGTGPRQDVYVGNLAWKVGDEDLADLLGRYGTVLAARVKMDRRGRSKGVGFVTMSKSDASRAVHALDGTAHRGRPLKVRFATPES
ncbi:MAG: DEAD/DEAH box helicase [Acidimicrobiia bacterium]|nr:DEAD/DEAH box helicase [Acidimicrobiia bacterium]